MDKKAIKVVLICSEFPPNVGGIGNHAYNLAKALSEAGVAVTVVADSLDITPEALHDFAQKEQFIIHWVRRTKPIFITYAKRIAATVVRVRRSEKVICSGKFALWQALVIKMLFPAKELIAVAHGTELDLRVPAAKKITDVALTRFSKIICVSNYTRQFIPKNIDANKVFVIHNGVNMREFEHVERISLAGSPALVTVGNVTERKGQENVIRALPYIVGIYPQVHYHIIGKPTNKEKMLALALQLGVAHLVTFHGAIDRSNLLQKLHSATIKLMLSNHTAQGDFEGFGIAVLEANILGIPAIGSCDSGIADAIVHGKTGYLVNQHKPEDVRDAITSVIDNYMHLSHQARQWAIQHDWTNIVKQYIDVINA